MTAGAPRAAMVLSGNELLDGRMRDTQWRVSSAPISVTVASK